MAFINDFRHKSEAYGNRDLRLALMDEQGIDKALMFPAAAHDIEYEFADNIPALYANIRAFNRWMLEEVGYVADGRMVLPPYIALADPDLAVKEFEQVLADGAPMIQTKSGHAHGGADNPFGGRSPADPSSTGSGRSSTSRRSAWPCISGGPTTRSTEPTGPRTQRRSSATSMPSSG